MPLPGAEIAKDPQDREHDDPGQPEHGYRPAQQLEDSLDPPGVLTLAEIRASRSIPPRISFRQQKATSVPPQSSRCAPQLIKGASPIRPGRGSDRYCG